MLRYPKRKRHAGQKACWAKPGYRAKMAELRKKQWKNPIARAKFSTTIAKTMPIGTERINEDGRIEVKISKQLMRRLRRKDKDGWLRRSHLVMMEIIGGPIPAGCVVHHIDENTLNDDPDNLMLMTNEAHSRYHTHLLLNRLRRDGLKAVPSNYHRAVRRRSSTIPANVRKAVRYHPNWENPAQGPALREGLKSC